MASDEILLKVALDLDKASSEFKDFTNLWEKHNNEVKKGEANMQKQADQTAKAYSEVNKKIKENVNQVASEAKAIDDLGKKLDNVAKKNKQSFDGKELSQFSETIKKVASSLGQLDNIELSATDIESLSKKLSTAKDDFEALNILVDFFEDKMKSSASGATDSMELLNQKIEETKINIKETEAYIKSMDSKIKTTAPGQDQANLISEREAAKQALVEEKVALADYEAQMKKARTENVAMTTQLRKVKDELIQLELAGERGSDRWIELSEKAKEYNVAIRDTNAELTRASKSTAGLDNLIGAATGIVAVFTAAQGAASLFGQENEDLQKSLVKLTGAIALLNGLQQIQLELSKKGTIANRAFTAVQTQYTIATNSAATATMRLVAASKLLGIGLIIGGLTYLISNWKEVSKWIGITSEKTERLNDLNKAAVTSASGEIGRLKSLKLELTNVNTPLSRQREIRKELLEQYPTYLKALGDEKSTVDEIEAAFDKLNKALLVNAKLKAAQDLISEEFRKVLEAERKAAEGDLKWHQNLILRTQSIFGADSAKLAAKRLRLLEENTNEVKKDYESFETFIQKYVGDLNQELDKLGGDPTKDGKRFEALKKEYEGFAKTLEQLLRRQESFRISLMENTREKEKALLNQALEDEKEAYRKQIEELKVSNAKKLELMQAYNKIYNEENGLAYEEYRKNIAEIDRKYDQELEEVKLRALSAIAEVYGTSEQLELQAIDKKFEAIRASLQHQIDMTEDLFLKQELQTAFNFTFTAQEDAKTNFEKDQGFDRVEREQEIAESILLIQQANMRDILKSEKVKQLQLLQLDRETLRKRLDVYKNSIKDEEQINLFEELTSTLENSLDADEIEAAAAKLRDAFGDKTANEILKTVESLKSVGNEINKISVKSKLGETVSEIAEWTSSLEGFGTKLGETLGLEGESLSEFAKATAQAIDATFQALSSTFDAEIEQRKAKVDAIQENINAVENEVEKEKQLYEDGYANNYEARQKDLESLKQQKEKEQEQLEKAQKKKAALNKIEMAGNLAMQLSNMITAITEVTKAHAGIPFVGIALAIGFIASMFAAIASAKSKAQTITGGGQSFRRGLREGSLDLKGPRHEERGFGVYNSKTGERVAEFEDGERVFVLNRSQISKYGHIMDALIADAQGHASIDSTLEGYYGVQKTGEKTMQVIQHVNNVTVSAQKAKESASKDSALLISEISKLREDFKEEFKGYKKERDNEVDSWETPHFFYVKKGSTVKKYPKKDIES